MSSKVYPAQMHTLEHILNGTIDQMFDCGRAFSSHIEAKKSKCDYHFDRNFTEKEIEKITAKVNEVVSKNLPVTETMMPRDEATAKFNLARLPEDAGETLRIVHVGDYDSCPCIGQHAVNTSEVGMLKIISTDWNDGVLRVRFKEVR